MNKRRLSTSITWILLVILIITSLINIYLLVSKQDEISEKIQKSVQAEISKITIPKVDKPADGYTPIKNIDYFDGEAGRDGLNATDEQVSKAVDDWFSKNPPKVMNGENGTNGVDGLTPMTRCNADKNRWEVRYRITDIWQLLNNEKVPCTVKE